jgi:hypothetical protein
MMFSGVAPLLNRSVIDCNPKLRTMKDPGLEPTPISYLLSPIAIAGMIHMTQVHS